MEYLIKIVNTQNHDKLRLFVRGPENLSDTERRGLQAKCGAIFAHYRGQGMVSVSLSQLRRIGRVEPGAVEEGAQGHLMTVRKMREVGALKPLMRKSRGEILRKLIRKKENFPLKFLWIVFVAPLIALHRFHTQDRRLGAKLRKIYGGQVGTQKQLVSQLKRTQRELEAGLVDREANRPLLEAFEYAVNAGRQIYQLTARKQKPVSQVAERLVEPLRRRLEGAGEKAFLGMVPVTLTLQGTPTPVLFTFRKEGQWLLLELQGLPEEAQGLQSSYAIALDKAEEALPHLLEAILRTALAQEEVKGSKFHISGREKIRLRNLEIFGLEPLPKVAPTTTAPQPAKWLHEMLCNFANPIEATPKRAHKDLMEDIFHSLGEAFPESAPLDKMEWLLLALEEEYVAFSKVVDRLSLQDQLYFYHRLQEQMEGVQKQIGGREEALKATSPLFKAFFTRLKVLKADRLGIKKKLLKSQKYRLSQTIEQKKATMHMALPEELRVQRKKPVPPRRSPRSHHSSFSCLPA